MYSKKSFIPFNLISINNKFYVYKNRTLPYLLIEHKQIISINDVKIDAIINKLKDFLRADGYIETGKNVEMMLFWGNIMLN